MARYLLRQSGRSVVGLVMIVMGASALCLPASASVTGPPSPVAEYRIPLDADPGTLDPCRISSIYEIAVANNLFDGLVEFDERMNVVPAIAGRWFISEDRCAYTFHLRDNVRFHNGRPVTGQDFVYSFTRILDPGIRSPAALHFSYVRGADSFRKGISRGVAGLYAPDRQTLVIELTRPFAPFLSILATVNARVVPQEVVGPDFGNHPVGTGPFVFRVWERSHRLLLEANPAYFHGPPAMERLSFYIYGGEKGSRIFSDFEAGRLEQISIPGEICENFASPGDDAGAYRFDSAAGLNLVYIGMNGRMNPLDDIRVRRAISCAIDTEAIVRTITGHDSIPAYGILPPGMAGGGPDRQYVSYSPARAQALLAEAGYPGGRGISPLEVLTVSRSSVVRNELAACAEYLSRLGIRLVVRTADDWQAFVRKIDKGEVHMFYAAWYADYPDPDSFLYPLFHSRSPMNRMHYSNNRVDALLESARHEADYLKRITLYQQVEKQVMDDAVIIGHYIGSHNILIQPWVEGIKISGLGAPYIPIRKARFTGRKRPLSHGSRVLGGRLLPLCFYGTD